MLNVGILPQEICRRLDLNEKSFRQHVMRIQGISNKWLEYISNSGHMLAYHKDLMDNLYNRKRLDGVLARIDKKLKKNPFDTKIGYLEVQTISQRDKNIQLHWELLTSAPLVAAFHKFIQDNIIDGKRHNPKRMAILPEDVKDTS